MSSSGPITAAVLSSAPALPSSTSQLRGHRLDQGDTGSVPARGLLGQFGSEEQRVPLGSLVQLIHPRRADQLRSGVPAEHAEVDESGGRQGLARPRPDRGHHGQRHGLAPHEVQPVRQRGARQMRIVDRHHQRPPRGEPAEQPDQGRVQDRGAEHAVGQDRLRPRFRDEADRTGARGQHGPEQRLVARKQIRGHLGPE